MQEADRDRLDVLLADQPPDLVDEAEIAQREAHAAVRSHALIDLDDVVARHERFRLPVEEVKQPRLRLPLDE